MPPHSPEPWFAWHGCARILIFDNNNTTDDADNRPVAAIEHNDYDTIEAAKEDADRIVACVNACAGIDDDKLWVIREALIFCHAYSRYLSGSDSALCGMAKIANLVASNTTDPLTPVVKESTT